MARMAKAMRDPDEESKVFFDSVEAAYGRGGYAKNPLGNYMSTEEFANNEAVSLPKLVEFLHCFDDIHAPIGVEFGMGLDATLKDLIEYDNGLLPLCALEYNRSSICGVIVKCALYYARSTDDKPIPAQLKKQRVR